MRLVLPPRLVTTSNREAFGLLAQLLGILPKFSYSDSFLDDPSCRELITSTFQFNGPQLTVESRLANTTPTWTISSTRQDLRGLQSDLRLECQEKGPFWLITMEPGRYVYCPSPVFLNTCQKTPDPNKVSKDDIRRAVNLSVISNFIVLDKFMPTESEKHPGAGGESEKHPGTGGESPLLELAENPAFQQFICDMANAKELSEIIQLYDDNPLAYRWCSTIVAAAGTDPVKYMDIIRLVRGPSPTEGS